MTSRLGLTPPFLIFPDQAGGFFVFQHPKVVLPGSDLAGAEREAKASNGWLAGGLPYPDHPVENHGWWGVFPEPSVVNADQLRQEADPSAVFLGPLSSALTYEKYNERFSTVRQHLAQGTTYQVNLTFPLVGKAITAGPWTWQSALRIWLDLMAHQGREGAFAVLGSEAAIESIIASLSPELFFQQSGSWIESRPMKGTAVRHADLKVDAARRDQLQNSSKTRAENLMITDMLRNDLGRLALAGRVEVPRLFDIEAYPTVWQMTSTVRAQVAPKTSLSDLMEALFPCASITGAPKISTQQVIGEVEGESRGWYTGTLGWHQPASSLRGEPRSRFSVLIRTLEFGPNSADFRLGVGGGIVWDSTPSSEWDEAWAKARFLEPVKRDFSLTEALLWESQTGFFLWDEHLVRLSSACRDFGGRLNEGEFRRSLEIALRTLLDSGQEGPFKFRVLVDPEFRIHAEGELVKPLPEVLSVALADQALGPESLLWRRYKTTSREIYDRAKRAGVDQTIHFNDRGELTESTSMNLVLDLGGRLVTPALSSGLLNGTFRGHLLREGDIVEEVLPVSRLAEADKIWLVNSVRRWKPARLSPILNSSEGAK